MEFSPDGETLVLLCWARRAWDIYAIPASGGRWKFRLTDGRRSGTNGPRVIRTTEIGILLQLQPYRQKCKPNRMSLMDLASEQLTSDGLDNWFPHPSPRITNPQWSSLTKDQKDPSFGKDWNFDFWIVGRKKSRSQLRFFYGGQGTIKCP